MNNLVHYKLKKLATWLHQNGLKNEANIILNKIAVPLGEVEFSDPEGIRRPIAVGPNLDNLKSIRPQTLREMVPRLRTMMEDIIPTINIIECPEEYAVYPNSIDDKMPYVRIGIATATDLDASRDIESIKNDLKKLVKITDSNIKENDDKIIYYNYKIDKLANYIKTIYIEKVKENSITILWGIFGEDFSASGFKLKTSLSPEWVMHDLIHLIENNPHHSKTDITRQVTGILYDLPRDILEHYKIKKDERNNVNASFLNLIESVTPDVNEDDFYATLGYIILNKFDDLIKIVPEFRSRIMYVRSGLYKAMKDLTGTLNFLP